MPYQFPPNTKFVAIHLAHCSCTGLPERLALSNELSVHTSPVMRLTEMDKSRIGQDYANAFERDTNFVIVASRPSMTAGVMDGESIELDARAHMLFYAILMEGIPNFRPGVTTWGSTRGNEEAWANRIVLINDIHRHPDAVPSRVNTGTIRRAELAVAGLIEAFRPSEDFMRVRRGVNALIDGWKRQGALDRLHAFVRALDGLMKLKKGGGEAQFAERTAIFATGNRIHDVAIEIYRLRSFQEHISEWPSKLAYVKTSDRTDFVTRRSFEAEVLAGACYHAMLADSAVRAEFRDGRVDGFWAAGGAAWTSKIDLDDQAVRLRLRRP